MRPAGGQELRPREEETRTSVAVRFPFSNRSSRLRSELSYITSRPRGNASTPLVLVCSSTSWEMPAVVAAPRGSSTSGVVARGLVASCPNPLALDTPFLARRYVAAARQKVRERTPDLLAASRLYTLAGFGVAATLPLTNRSG
ncbi:hypothetical protein MTO96_018103 [Rhipicephalus appendiculatus]